MRRTGVARDWSSHICAEVFLCIGRLLRQCLTPKEPRPSPPWGTGVARDWSSHICAEVFLCIGRLLRQCLTPKEPKSRPSPPWGRGWPAPALSSAGAGRVRGSRAGFRPVSGSQFALNGGHRSS